MVFFWFWFKRQKVSLERKKIEQNDRTSLNLLVEECILSLSHAIANKYA